TELVDDLPGARVLVVGDAMLDRYMHGDVVRISPEAPVPVVRLEGTDAAPGGAGNVAAGVAALGARTRLVAAVGDDDAGRTLGRLLDDAGVETSNLVVAGDRHTTVKTRVIGRGRQMLRVDRESRSRVAGGAA
ncbi:MAG: PfkB family carbohydrate kinase, partial [Gemmatimonadota bacterium]